MLSFQKLDVYRRSIGSSCSCAGYANASPWAMPIWWINSADPRNRSHRTSPKAPARPVVPTRPGGIRSDVMKIDELINDEHHAIGVALLERVVAMLTKMIDP